MLSTNVLGTDNTVHIEFSFAEEIPGEYIRSKGQSAYLISSYLEKILSMMLIQSVSAGLTFLINSCE